MNPTIVLRLLICISLLVGTSLASASEKNHSLRVDDNVVASTPNLKNEIQTVLDKDLSQYRLPALSVSLKLSNEKTSHNYVSGYYSVLKNKNITPETLFQIGSITKTF